MLININLQNFAIFIENFLIFYAKIFFSCDAIGHNYINMGKSKNL